MLQRLMLRPRGSALAASVLRAGASSDVFTPAFGARSLRTARGGSRRHKDHMARIAKLEALAQQREQARMEQRQRVLEARAMPRAIPAYIRVRDLAKTIRQPLDKVLKRVVTKSNRRFQLKAKDHPPAEFGSVKKIVLPFRVAQDVAEQFGVQVAYDDVEPQLLDAASDVPEELLGVRQPVIAVMGHVDHGKTTLMDTLRRQMKAGLKQIAPYEKHGITQKINVCEAALTPDVKATFLDTPGHFHFFRMRSSAAQVADAVLLIVAADEGVLLQTEESIGAIEEAGLPAVICINKVDLLGEDGDEQVTKIVDELRSFVALQDSPVLTISGKTGAGLDDLKHAVWELVTGLADEQRLDAMVGSDTQAEGLVLESVALKGRGTVLRVLIKNGELAAKQHFVAGMIHGVVRNMRDAEGREVKRALPGTVVDITYSNKSKNVDAPNEHGFFVLPEARAKQVIEQRELALEFNDCLLPDDGGALTTGTDAEYTEAEEVDQGESDVEETSDEVEEEDDDVIDENDLIETKSIIVKADGAGSLTSIQDTVDEMPGISTVPRRRGTQEGRHSTRSMSSANGQTITVCGNVFRLVETIGRGSYGTVHKAINLSSGAAVAVKMIGKDKLRRPHERQSIEKEIETMRVAVEQFENGHPHIVRLLCTKESQHHIFIVQEYCAGGDIAQLMKANNGLKEEQARLYLSQLASGLQFLRSQNVVHRDLKPANLLLSSRNLATAKLKIADFGFARELGSEMMAESVVGSPLYMAPELLEYKSYDAKADLWSVGIILYEMLVNEHPFLVVDKCHATNHLALRRNIYRYFERYGHVRLPKKVQVSPECEQLVEALLRVDPRKRISFEDFFRAPFLLPPAPSDAEAESAAGLDNSEDKQPLVAEKQPEYEDWATFSDEYVMVENEYEDVGRKVLDGQDLNVDLDEKHHHTKEQVPAAVVGSTIVDGGIQIRDVVIDTSSPRNGKVPGAADVPVPTEYEGETKMPAREVIPAAKNDNWLVGERRQWVTDDNRLEELLGICYKSFSCGSVALFVPTPFGDYIAFHEGCPHYYLSEESIAASKKDDRNPPYVLGHIIYIEDHETTDNSNPYCLREGTKYHVVSVTPLATSSHDANGSVGTADSSSASDELPLSQVLTGRTVASDVEEHGLHEVASEPPTVEETSHSPVEHQRISFRSFQISSLALFFLKGGKLPYVAFNEGAPNYYLANESIQAAILGVGTDRTPPAYICGEIIFIDTFQATEDFNPYRLPYGTRFHVVTVANPKRT